MARQETGGDLGVLEGEGRLPFATEETLFETYRRTAPDAGPRLDLLVFRLGPEEYAGEVGSLLEICKVAPLTQVPHVPSCYRGLFSLRGTIVPVIDLKARLKLPFETTPSGPRAKIVIARAGARGEGKVGMLVDELVQVVRVPASHLQPPPSALSGRDHGLLRGVILLEAEAGRRLRAGNPAARPGAGMETGAGETAEGGDTNRLVILLDLAKVLDPDKIGAAP